MFVKSLYIFKGVGLPAGAYPVAPATPLASGPHRILQVHASTHSSFYRPANFLKILSMAWLGDLSGNLEMKFISGMRQYVHSLPSGICSRWSLFAGSGIASRCSSGLENVLRGMYGIGVSFDGVLYCEKNEKKQQFIVDQFSPAFLISDTCQLAAHSAPNLQHGGERDLLPLCWQLDAGFPCTSRSPLSSQRRNNVHCVQEE